MPRDLYEEAGINPNTQPRDLYAEAGIKPTPNSQTPKQLPQKTGNNGLLGSALTGINSGLVGLAGLPVDSIVNAKDLLTMGGGTLLHKLGLMKDINSIPEATNREDVIGSSAWLSKQARKSDSGQIALNNPDDSSLGRMIHAASSTLPNVLLGGRMPQNALNNTSIVAPWAKLSPAQKIIQAAPETTRQMIGSNLSNAALNVTSGAAGQGAAELGFGPATQSLATFLPGATATGGGAAIKGIVRGGEQGRQQMAQRVDNLNKLGITNIPPGVASGTGSSTLLDSVLSKLPGSNLAYYSNANKMQDSLKAASDKTSNMLSPISGPVEAGQALQRGIKQSIKDDKGDVGTLYNYFEDSMPKDQIFPVQSARDVSNQLQKPIHNSPDITAEVKSPVIQRISKAILNDSAPTNATGMIFVPGKGGRIAAINPPKPATNGGLSFDAIREMRSEIGPNTQTSSLIGNKEAGQYKQLYGALTEDMKNAANLSDQHRAFQAAPNPQAVGPFIPQGLLSTDALSLANKANKSMMDKAELLSPYANQTDSQTAYTMLSNAMNNKGPTAQTILNSLPAEERSVIAATKLDSMGRATPGNQNAVGDRFSSDSFLTNYDKLKQSGPELRDSLFGADPTINSNINNLANAASYIKSGSKAFANPSGTTQAMTNLGAASTLGGALGAGIVSGNFWPLIGAGAGLAGSYGLGKAVQSPWFINKMLQSSGLTDAERASLLFNSSIPRNQGN